MMDIKEMLDLISILSSQTIFSKNTKAQLWARLRAQLVCLKRTSRVFQLVNDSPARAQAQGVTTRRGVQV